MRKMSATSSDERNGSAVGLRLFGAAYGQSIKRTDDGARGSGCNFGVEGGRTQVRVAQQRLYDPNINPFFQQMGGKAMPQRVRPDPLANAGRPCGFDNNAKKLSGTHRLEIMLAGE